MSLDAVRHHLGGAIILVVTSTESHATEAISRIQHPAAINWTRDDGAAAKEQITRDSYQGKR